MKKQIAQKKWDASIYKRHINLAHACILHVRGEVTTDPFREAIIERKSYQGFQSRILKLKVVTYQSSSLIPQPQVLHYPELLIHDQQYQSIEIYIENDSLITINDIYIEF